MLIHLLQVLFVAICTVSRSALNLTLYSVFTRIFNRWLGLNGAISFFASLYCLSKIVAFFKRSWFNARIKNKKPDEKIVVNELTFESPTTRVDNQFETDWNYLLDDDTKSMFPDIVNVPFTNNLLLIAAISLIDYQTKYFEYSYAMSVIRTLGCLIILICGSSIRYQTLFERDKKNFFNLMIKKRDEFERYIIYYNNLPIGSVCLQIMNNAESTVFMVQLYQINSKFEDYMYDIGYFTSGKLIERIQNYGNENRKSVYLVWSIPSCKQKWKFSIIANKFLLRNSYQDFSFLPFVKSYVEQYQYVYSYRDLPNEIVNE